MDKEMPDKCPTPDLVDLVQEDLCPTNSNHKPPERIFEEFPQSSTTRPFHLGQDHSYALNDGAAENIPTSYIREWTVDWRFEKLKLSSAMN